MQIFLCLKGVGKHHGSFTEFLVEDLLNLIRVDMRFLQTGVVLLLFCCKKLELEYLIFLYSIFTEAHIDDQTYIGIVIVLLNAAVSNPNILPLLPTFIFRHHRYFRDKYNHLFPQELPLNSLHSLDTDIYMYKVQEQPASELEPIGDIQKFLTEVRRTVTYFCCSLPLFYFNVSKLLFCLLCCKVLDKFPLIHKYILEQRYIEAQRLVNISARYT